MMKRGRSWLTVVLVAVVLAAGLFLARVGLSAAGTKLASGDPCPASLKADEAKVRTSRWEFPEDLPGIGDYVEIHWQLRAAGNPCARAPGPTDWHYQGVIRLRPEDARALVARYDWQPFEASPSSDTRSFDTPAQAWASLAPFTSAEARWLHSDRYDQQDPQRRWRRVYLDPDRALVFFALYDH
jgi:hypothetical protein